MRVHITSKQKIGVLVLTGVLLFLAGRLSMKAIHPRIGGGEIRMPDPAFGLLNPLLDCEVDNSGPQYRELPDFSGELEAYITDAKTEGIISDIGIYFRDLNNGPWRAINADADFSPASLLKLPLMVAYLKWAQSDPSVLDVKLSYMGEPAKLDQPQPDTPQELALRIGASYRVSNLIERMIVYSDNNAKDLLQVNIPEERITRVFQDIGLNQKVVEDLGNSISVKEYASFFRVLYNASYLNREYSNRALKYLVQSTFARGLLAGVPQGIQVAHKYGVRNTEPGDTTRQLHDCGIVYYPQRPYLLCIMTRGSQFGGLSVVIQEISRLIYSEVAGH